MLYNSQSKAAGSRPGGFLLSFLVLNTEAVVGTWL